MHVVHVEGKCLVRLSALELQANLSDSIVSMVLPGVVVVHANIVAQCVIVGFIDFVDSIG